MKVTKAWNEEQGTWNVILGFGIRDPANNENPKSSTNIQIPLHRFLIQDCREFNLTWVLYLSSEEQRTMYRQNKSS